MDMIDRFVRRSCDIVIRNSFLIRLRRENVRSPLQFVTIKQIYILVATPTFGKVSYKRSAFISLCRADILYLDFEINASNENIQILVHCS